MKKQRNEVTKKWWNKLIPRTWKVGSSVLLSWSSQTWFLCFSNRKAVVLLSFHREEHPVTTSQQLYHDLAAKGPQVLLLYFMWFDLTLFYSLWCNFMWFAVILFVVIYFHGICCDLIYCDLISRYFISCDVTCSYVRVWEWKRVNAKIRTSRKMWRKEGQEI